MIHTGFLMGGDIFANAGPSLWAALFEYYPLVLLMFAVSWLKKHGMCD